MNYKHFIITRFNLPLGKGGLYDKNNISTQNINWLSNRYYLFDKYCFPSIYNQNNKDFIWLCFFDCKTPKEYKLKNQEYHEKLKNFVPVYLTYEESQKFLDVVNMEIYKHLGSSDYILMTRMDNDDSLAYNAIESIQNFIKEINASDTYIINPLKGVQYYEGYNCSIMVKWRASHFLTMVIKRGINDNVYSINHTDIKKTYIVKQLITKNPLWMEVCHDNNLVNDVHLKWFLAPIKKGVLSCFFVKNSPKRINFSISHFRLKYLYPKMFKKLIFKIYGK